MKDTRTQRTSGKSWPYGFLILGILVIAALACGPLGALSGVAQAPTPTLMTLPGADNSGGNGFTFVSPSKSNLKSYHSKFSMTFTGTKSDGTPDNGTFSMEQSHTADPAATSIQITGEGSALDQSKTGTTQMVQIGDTAYVVTNDNGTPKCVSMSGSTAAGLVNPAFSPDQFLTGGDTSGAQRILPDEVANGILSQHWRFTKENVALLAQNWTSYTVDVWTAVDGGYATKGTFVGDGEDISSGGGKGHVEWQFDLLEVNTDITISPPEGCSAPAGSDIPKMTDAADVFAVGPVTNYTTASPVADVVAFYQAQLPAQGWTAGTADTSGPAATLEFTKGSQKVTITIADSGGKTTVLIQVE